MATASMMLILGFYGSVDLVLCSSVSRFVQVNSLFVRDIKFSICLKTTQKVLTSFTFEGKHILFFDANVMTIDD